MLRFKPLNLLTLFFWIERLLKERNWWRYVAFQLHINFRNLLLQISDLPLEAFAVHVAEFAAQLCVGGFMFFKQLYAPLFQSTPFILRQ